jgi:sulfane dehydrogenase subunit SoxC
VKPDHPAASGRLRKAPENFLDREGIRTVFAEGKRGRRDFIRNAFAAAAAGAAVPAALAQVNPVPTEGGDPNILTLPEHTRGLGQPVVTDGYGKPSKFEANVQRRQSPGLTQTTQSSVSFAPLQSLFGIVTPSGLHFERHHQGWWDIDPSKHRLMINGMVKSPKVFTMDEIMRLPSVSRFHFIECGANTGMEWGNVAVPTAQYSARHVVVQRVHWRTADHPAGDGRCRPQAGQVCAGRGCGWLVHDAHHPDEPDPFGRSPGGLSGRTAKCCGRKTATPCVWWCRVQGVSWVKYLRRLEVGDQPWATKDEAVHYIDLMPDGQHRQYTSIQEVQERGDHAVWRPGAAGQGLLQRHGPCLVGSRQGPQGRRVRGRGPQLAPRAPGDTGAQQMPDPLQHRLGMGRRPAIIQSRATDETGHVQPNYTAVACGARHPLDLPQQRDPVMAGAR